MTRAEAVDGGLEARLLHVSLVVTDLDATMAFLGELFGYEAVFGPVALGDAFAKMTGTSCPEARLVQLGREGGGEVIELIEPQGVDISVVPMAHLALAVADLDAALRAVHAAGGAEMGEAVTFAEGRSAYIRAPGGVVVELEELFA
jgi:predicted enzyme related to lactoylglutathione lyase